MNSNNLYIDRYLFFQLNKKQEKIGEFLLNCDLDDINNVGIMGGLSGVVLTLSLYYRNTSDERFLDKLDQTIQLINKKIIAGRDIVSSYAQGIAGYAWLIIYLKENQVIDVDINDYLSEFDDFLFRKLILMLEEKQYDSLHGAIGVGTYFLKRENIEATEQVIDRLYNDRKNISGYAIWSRRNQQSNKDDVDFGLAHGIPGILFFLFKCYLKEISSQKCNEMIRESIAFMINYMNPSGIPSYFPYTIECNLIKQHDRRKNWSRLAWCYGDLSILYVFLNISSHFPINLDIPIMLEHVAKRRNMAATDVTTTGICHGMTGIAYLFFRLFCKTRNHHLEEASHYWLKKTLYHGNDPTGVAGFVFPENLNIQSLDLLTGISGVGSVFLSFLNPNLISWEESIFLS